MIGGAAKCDRLCASRHQALCLAAHIYAIGRLRCPVGLRARETKFEWSNEYAA